MNYAEMHKNADRIFYQIQDEPYSKATQIINSNLAEGETEEHTYLWECVRARLNAKQKKGAAQ